MSVSYVITGIRDTPAEAWKAIETRMRAILSENPREVVFGGARGSDTMALEAAGMWRPASSGTALVVIVPGVLENQPQLAQAATRRYATTLVQLRQVISARTLQARNNAMLMRGLESDVCRVVAFTDGRSAGGTHNTIQAARRLGIPVEVVLFPKGQVDSHDC